MATAELGMTPQAFHVAVHRLAQKRRLARVHSDFYVIVPAEYRAPGVVPADWFVVDLMAHLGVPFYVGVLTAAAYHGAAHQRPQKYHVVTAKPMREIVCHESALRFFWKANPDRTLQQQITGHTGYIPVSTPEATAFDLLRYERSIGGLNRVMTVLQELAEALDPRRLVAVATSEGVVARAQRLGWLLEQAGGAPKAAGLAEWVDSRAPRFAKLDPRSPATGSTRDDRWRLILNYAVEGDL